MKHLKYLLCILLLSGCTNKPTNTRSRANDDLSKMIMAGFSMHNVPNELDVPGVVFRVSPEGVRYEVTVLEDLKTRRANAELTEYTGERGLRLDYLLNFMGLAKSKLDADLQGHLADSINVEFKLSGAELERANDLDIDIKLSMVKPTIIANMQRNGREDHRYYIIRESLLATKMDYKVGRTRDSEKKLNASLLKLASTDNSFKVNDNDEFPLSFDYQTPLRVFYKVEEIVLTGSGTGAVTLARVDITEPITTMIGQPE